MWSLDFFRLMKLIWVMMHKKIGLGLKITIDASIHLEELLDKLNCETIWDYNEDLHTQFIELHDEPNIDYEIIAQDLIPNLYEIVAVDAHWENGYDGFIQLIVLMMISEKLKEDGR